VSARGRVHDPAGGEPPPPPPVSLDRLSLNQITIDQWTLPQVAEGCARAGVTWIGPWRQRVEETGLAAAAAAIRDAGLSVSSLCRGGFFPTATDADRGRADNDNRRAVEEAATLGTDVLVLVCGPPLGRDLAGARRMIAEGIERLVPHAAACGVRLAIEPLHPMMIAHRSAIVTLGEANDLAARFDAAHVGVIVDAYHVWWDPRVEYEIARAGERILGYHVSDWLVETTDPLRGRGMMGDGIIPLARLRAAVEAAGYRGPIEVEVINDALAARDGEAVLRETCERFVAHG
jgi:sugar phosphate isomerase/epimerase